LPYHKLFTIALKECFARVQVSPIFQKHGVETEDASLKALHMEPGGASHFLCATDMLQYLFLNQELLTNEVTIIIPGLRRHIATELGRSDQDPGEPRVEGVIGTLQFQMLKNMSEYRVGEFDYRDIAIISAWNFFHAVQSSNGEGMLSVGYTEGEHNCPVHITFKRSDFYSVMYQKSVLDLKGLPTEEPVIRPIAHVANMKELQDRSWNRGDIVDVASIEGKPARFRICASHHGGLPFVNGELWLMLRGG
jgi:hypothetical protein